MQILAKFLVFSSLLVISLVHARISDLRLCVDENCSVPVSIARSVLSYNSDDARILSFKPSDKIVIYSKSAGSKPDLWGAEINGKRGYVPKDLIREQKILNSNLKFTVPTEQVAQEAEKNPENEATVKPFLPTPVPDTQQELNAENDPNVIVVDGTTIYMSEDSDIEKTITTGPPPPPETIPPAPSSETPLQPPTNLNSAKEESIPDQPQEELTTPEPETPDKKPLVEEEGVKTDDSTEAVSEPPEVAKDETVMEYISDTLTGWLDASGEGKQEEVDTGQDVGQSEEVTESVTAEPPEDVQVDLTKINLLSTKGNKQEPEVNEALKVVVDEPPVQTVPSPHPDVEERESSDEIYHQYPSSTTLQAEEMASQETSTEVSFNEEDSRPPLSAEDETSSEVPLYSEEVTTESAEVTSPPPEETASEETTMMSQFEILQPLEEQKQEEVQYSPYQNYETGQVVEVETEKVEEVTTETTLVVEEAHPPVVEDETTVPYPPLVSEEVTPAPAVQEDAAESTTSADSVETTPSADTAETTMTEESPQEETTPLERDSGGIFADWVYNLFGSSSSEEATDATPEQVITEKLLAEEPPAEESASSGSWFSFGSTVEPEISTADVTGDACFAESCAQVGAAPNHQPADSEQYHQQHHQAHSEASAIEWDVVASSGTILYLVVTAITVLLFTLGHYFIEKMRRDGALIAKINTLQRELLVSSKECLILKEDLETTKEKLTGIETTTSDSSGAILEIRAELSESQRLCQEQEEQIKTLESELEAATEAGLELNKMLSEFLSTQRGSQDLVKSVELLQGQLNKQQATISSMNQTLNLKTQENETLRLELTAANDKILDLELDIDGISKNLSTLQDEKLKLKRELEENCCTLANQLQEATNLREVEVDAVKKKLDASETSLKEVQNALKHRNSELEALKESISKLSTLKEDNSDKANRKLEAMLDVSKVQAELKLLISERDVLKERLQCEEDARQLLEDHMKMVKDEVQKLHEKGEAAEKEKQDALTRLEVLSEYFKEKEAQLQKELGLQEAFSVMKNEDFSTTQTRIKSLEEEVENFNCNAKPKPAKSFERQISVDYPNITSNRNNKLQKQWPPRPATPVKIAHQSPAKIAQQSPIIIIGAQNETLKQEIIDQEKGLKGQIVTLEKKAHENWIAARQAERKLDESKQESSTLRNRLTMLEKGTSLVTQNGEEGKGAATRLLESNGGELPTSPGLHIGDSPTPHFMLPPPPPLGAFMPPPPPPEYMQSPPLPPLYPDRRPPPLGRMSSPPPHHFSPPPPDRYNSSPYRPRSPGSDRSLPRYRYGSRSPSPPPYGGGGSNHDYPPYHSAGRPWEEPRAGFRPVPRDKELKGSTMSSGHSSSDSVGKSSSHRSGKRGK
ncbi:transport and Golgi organization protein 1 isoform X1 [Cloeon dipterum]|uniref:transport and Golgi organization protein 1 isoform X1 n=1 Tax=Cloeon dipterum TaxID=197152 RepID=UPI00321F9C7F